MIVNWVVLVGGVMGALYCKELFMNQLYGVYVLVVFLRCLIIVMSVLQAILQVELAVLGAVSDTRGIVCGFVRLL